MTDNSDDATFKQHPEGEHAGDVRFKRYTDKEHAGDVRFKRYTDKEHAEDVRFKRYTEDEHKAGLPFPSSDAADDIRFSVTPQEVVAPTTPPPPPPPPAPSDICLRMTMDWQPGQLFYELLDTAKIDRATITESFLAEFRAYWMSAPSSNSKSKRNAGRWDKALFDHIQSKSNRWGLSVVVDPNSKSQKKVPGFKGEAWNDFLRYMDAFNKPLPKTVVEIYGRILGDYSETVQRRALENMVVEHQGELKVTRKLMTTAQREIDDEAKLARKQANKTAKANPEPTTLPYAGSGSYDEEALAEFISYREECLGRKLKRREVSGLWSSIQQIPIDQQMDAVQFSMGGCYKNIFPRPEQRQQAKGKAGNSGNERYKTTFEKRAELSKQQHDGSTDWAKNGIFD